MSTAGPVYGGVEAGDVLRTGGSRLCDVALFSCAIAGFSALTMGLQGFAVWFIVLFVSLRARRASRRLRAVVPGDEDRFLLDLGGVVSRVRVRSARMGRNWVSFSTLDDEGRSDHWLLFADSFHNRDDFRVFRLRLRRSLRQDAPGEDGGWSALHRRWFPDSHG